MPESPFDNKVSALSSIFRERKEALLKQNAKVIWMCGLSGAGKSTLAIELDKALTLRGFLCQIIDGDMVRSGLNRGLGYSVEDRQENLRRVAEMAKLFTQCGVITIVSFISPTRTVRQMTKEIVGPHDYIEVFIDAPLSVCEQRDIKGLYKLAREGKLKNFTGIDSPFESPEHPDLRIDSQNLSVKQCTAELFEYILPLIEHKKNNE